MAVTIKKWTQLTANAAKRRGHSSQLKPRKTTKNDATTLEQVFLYTLILTKTPVLSSETTLQEQYPNNSAVYDEVNPALQFKQTSIQV